MTSEEVGQEIRTNRKKWGLYMMCRWAYRKGYKPEFVINALKGRV